ncbi:DUF4262 domain-containing protein [Streptomyces sp. NPDC017979]|uniref:DUF4262 domain-containing protein n=1 Tax=Streptomyces sp. NPDC017979 TaxID=3365024 RepID=UPI0037B1F4B8
MWHTHGSPEPAMLGPGIRTMHTLLNSLGDKAPAGTLPAADQEHHGIIEGYPVALRDAALRWYRTFFGRAIDRPIDGKPQAGAVHPGRPPPETPATVPRRRRLDPHVHRLDVHVDRQHTATPVIDGNSNPS